ncbi:STAS domain-containing protein [Ectobacillus ponti]|uniref:STAS domain-containing protein n=1 Tax=Ectobacillus ponti TaxID=2961894 RepID=A0AA42BTG8_9BACI|nr:STAS domain-containing protein [Ectobacillus ponti]MCP8969463.1 STAS domain-containing protein [Ectobacillus ponti]
MNKEMYGKEAELKVESHYDYVKVSLNGALVYGKTNEVKEQLADIAQPDKEYILDLSWLQSIDSVGFGVIINFAKKAGSKNIAVIVKDALIRELFSISKLHLLFPVEHTLEGAVKALQEKKQTKLQLEEY